MLRVIRTLLFTVVLILSVSMCQSIFEGTKTLAEQGHVSAQYNLGLLYGDGMGVSQDAVMAYVWSSVAAAQGSEEARANRDKAVIQLTQAQLTRGQDIAARCFASGYKDCN